MVECFPDKICLTNRQHIVKDMEPRLTLRERVGSGYIFFGKSSLKNNVQ